MSIKIDIDIDVMHKGTGDRRTLGRDLRAGQCPSAIHLISFCPLLAHHQLTLYLIHTPMYLASRCDRQVLDSITTSPEGGPRWD